MFFSVNDLYNYGKANQYIRNTVARFCGLSYGTRPRKKHYARYVREVKEAILNRDTEITTDDYDEHYIAKWHRPWDVVPALANFTAPDGEYAVGVEIELGFVSRNAARSVAAHLQHWKHVALDYEGGNNPIEATFPPILYSKFNSQSQPVRYLKWLSDNPHLVTRHREDSVVGTHVNVSKGGQLVRDGVLARINRVMDYSLSNDEKRKYFGRAWPYRYGRSEGGKFIEFKMFNSTTDWKALRRYTDIAVELAALVYDGTFSNGTFSIGEEERIVRVALERGYNKRNKKKAAKVSSQQVQGNDYALAA